MRKIALHLNLNLGITLIELFLVIALIAILGASVSPFLSRFVLTNNLDVVTNKVTSIIRKAQTYAMNNKNNAIWGICTSENKLRMYSDSCTSPTFYEDFNIPTSISVFGLNDTIFNGRGEPSNILNITISSDIDSKTIDVNGAGSIAYSGASNPSPFPTPTPGLSPTPSPFASPTPSLTPSPSPTPSPTPLLSPTPTPIPLPTPTPTSSPTTCAEYCASLLIYSSGICRKNPSACTKAGEVYQSGGSILCPGDRDHDSCCCSI